MPDVSTVELQEILDAESVPEDYAVLMTLEGVVLAHGTNSEVLTKNVKDLSDEYDAILEEASLGQPFDVVKRSIDTNQKVLNVYYPISFEGVDQMWVCINVVEYDFFLKSANQARMIIIILAAALLIIFGVVIYLIMNAWLVRPIKMVTGVVEKQADLDFSPMEVTKKTKAMLARRDEIGEMCRATDEMTGKISGFLASITDKSNTLAATAEELTATSQQAALTANEMREVVGCIAQGATAQAEDTQTATKNVEKVNEIVDDNYDIVKRLMGVTEEIRTRGDEGQESIRNLMAQTEISGEISSKVNDIVKDTYESANQIQKASEMIQSVAEQTNLLALNAAIEAARAGESGKGFAVVAQEIKKLAEEAAGFTKEISEIIGELQDKAGNAVTMMVQSQEALEKQGGYARSTGEKFNLISESVSTANTVSHELESSFGVLLNNSKEMGTMTDNLSAIAEENAATSEEVAAHIENQTQAVDDISKASESLAEIAVELQAEVSKFKL